MQEFISLVENAIRRQVVPFEFSRRRHQYLAKCKTSRIPSEMRTK